ncbi:lipopolysaccharide biosynthesis protein [Litorimonas sp. WD9-15]|uniref:lipopolysaccharide biosynthesis protein n=1 Tax=Litorimonas sp. WD9-15 TaxID=3418716 RepID=UPI003D082A34
MMGRSMLAYLPVNLANVLTSFGTIIILTRLLAPEEFGIYAIAMITMQFVHMGLFTWMEAAMARFQARAEREDNVASHLTTLYRLAAGTGLIGLTLIMGLLWILPLPDRLSFVLIFALGSTCLQVLFNLGMEAHRAAHRIKRYSLTYSTQTLVSFTLGILFILFSPLREASPFVGIIIGLLIVGGLDLLFMRRRMKGGTYDNAKTKTYLAYGMPLCIGLLLSYALNSADVYLIAALMGEASAGEYNAGYNLSNRSLEILFVWVSMAVTPVAVTAMEQEGTDRSRDILKNYGATLMWIAFPAATGIALVSQDAGFILGEGVREGAVTVMPWIAFAGLINGVMTYYVHRAFMLSGQTQKYVWALVLPVILNIGLNLVLIPKFGLMGAVWATILCYGIALIIATVLARQDYPLPLPMRAAVELALCCGLMSGAVLLLPLKGLEPGVITLLIKASVGAVVYLAACWVLNAAECRQVVHLLRRRFDRSSLVEVAE